MQVVFINECKSYEISSQMFFNVIDQLVKTQILQNKIYLVAPFRMLCLMNQRCI